MGPNGYPIQTGTQQVPVQGTELKPFQTYGGEFVAPVNAQQTAGIAGTNTAANEAQPYFGAATKTLGTAQAGTVPVNQAAIAGTQASSAPLSQQDIDRYLSPYLNTVLGSESALINQNNQQQQAGQLGNAIRSGAFGGDRTGVAAANLEQQQNLAAANIYSNILNQGYQSALGTAQGQQQIGLAGAKQLADIGSTAYGEGANTASELAGLGTGAQTAGLQGAQAQIAAGTVQQQTQQAQDTAEYQQFLQQQSYPFQVAQFLANIAEGTGALSGSTTTTQQPGGFFSDERLKEDMEPIGKTFDGQPIYRYRMKGDNREQIGLSAQEVEKRHPHAVGLAGGYRFVDYGKATDDAANRGHFYSGGVTRASLHERRAYAYGGGPDDGNGGLGAVLAAQQAMYGDSRGKMERNIPTGGATHQLAVAQGTPAPPPSSSSKVQQTIGLGKDAYQGYKWATKPPPSSTPPPSSGVAGPQPTSYTPGLNSMPDAAVPTQPGVTTNFETMGSPGTTTTFDAAPVSNTAGLGAADTSAASAAAPAAADTAATGASEAAATGAAESAATGAAADAAAGSAVGAAGGAAAGAAADAAATEAAALAAEYAASYAAAAAIAAKRGGRIKYASGGTPYSLEGDQIDIPDEEQSGEHLQSPGPLVKQPTGLQTASMMGDPQNWSKLSGSMFSNQALATGGVAGYATGGQPRDARGQWAPFNSSGELLDKQEELSNAHAKAGAKLNALSAGQKTGLLALTPDHIKATPEWQSAKKETDKAFAALRDFNTTHGKLLSKLGTAERLAYRKSKKQGFYSGGVAGRRGYDDGGAPEQDSDPGDVEPAQIASDTDRGAGVVGHRGKSWRDYATAENVVPLLTGLAAMGTAPTRSAGVALAAGLGAGAQSYLNTRESLAKSSQEQAKTRGIDIANQLAAMKVKAAKDYLDSANAPSAAPVNPYGTTPTDKAESAAEKMDTFYRNKYFVQPWTKDEQDAQRKARSAAIAGITQPLEQVEAARNQRILNQTAQNQSAAQHEADALYAKATDPDATEQERQSALVAYNAIHQWTGDTYVTDAGGNKTISRTGAPAIGVAKQRLAPTGDIVTDAYGRQFQYDKQTNTLKPIGIGGITTASTVNPPAPKTTTGRGAGSGVGFQQPVADQPKVLEAIETARAAGDIAPTTRNVNDQLLKLSSETATGPATQTVQKLAAVLRMPSGSTYQEIGAYLDRQASLQARSMGVPNTNAGLAAAERASGTTEYTPQALQEKVKFADALNSGVMAYRQGLERIIGTGPTPDLTKYQAYRASWAKNFDPDIFRAEDAQRRGDQAELKAIRARIGSKGMKLLAQKSANLRELESGVIP